MEECEKKEQRRDRRPCQPWREESVRVPKQTKTKTTLQDSDGSLNWSMRRHLGLSIKMTAGGISPSCRCYLTVCKVMKEKIKIDGLYIAGEDCDRSMNYKECVRCCLSFFSFYYLQGYYQQLCTYLPKALKRATISLRVSWKRIFFIDARSKAVGLVGSKGPEKRIFKAVPSPCVCNFPHSLHFSQPTQSMMRVMLRKWWRNSSFSFRACFPPVNIVDSLKCGWKDLIQFKIHFMNRMSNLNYN